MAHHSLPLAAASGILLLSLIRLSAGSAAQTFTKQKNQNFRAGKSVFDYDSLGTNGPSKWGDISPDFELCKKGQHQSPIDMQINSTKSDGVQPEVFLNEAVVNYAPSGSNFLFECAAGVGKPHCSTIKYYRETYHMVQAHFHSPSEHRINGEQFPLEIHFVHKAESGNGLLVLGVVFIEGAFNENVDTLLKAALNQGKAVVDFPAFLQPGADLCTYEGSLTTPPCTEGVHWLISNSRLSISLLQEGQYRQMVGEVKNNRPIQNATAVAHPEARCYANVQFSGGIAKKPADSHSSPSSGGPVTKTGTASGEPPVVPSASGGTTAATPSPPPAGNAAAGNGAPPPPPPPPTASGGGAACFPASATVQLSTGARVRMDALRIGDEVAVGGGKFSRVYLFSHRDALVEAPHVRATLASGRQLTLSPGHYLPVNGALAPAMGIAAGDALDTVAGREAVVRVQRVRARGLYNPHTEAGVIAVDDVLCSTYTTAVPVPAAQALLAPLRALFRAGAVSERSAGSFLQYGAGRQQVL